jgi:hypothetical protein
MDWLAENWGNLTGVGGLAAGIACLVVAVRIYRRQKRESDLAHEKQERNITASVSTVVPKLVLQRCILPVDDRHSFCYYYP